MAMKETITRCKAYFAVQYGRCPWFGSYNCAKAMPSRHLKIEPRDWKLTGR